MSNEEAPKVLDANFWESRWQSGNTGWDIGHAAPPITEYMVQQPNDVSILIPGCGNAYEAGFLVNNGFKHITLVDISSTAVDNLDRRFEYFDQINVFCEDFFKHIGRYDFIIEQTFFCAQPPEKRNDYAKRAATLLKPGGRLIGVLFNREFDREGPPFGGNEEEYKKIFEPYFEIERMEPCRNSVRQRAGTELFINLRKKG